MNEYERLDLVLDYLNEGIFDKFKKNKPSSSKPIKVELKYDSNLVAASIKKIEKKLLTSSYKKIMVDKLNKYGVTDVFMDGEEPVYTIKDLPDIVAEPFGKDAVTVIDGSQDECIALSYILNDIIKELVKIPEFKDGGFSTGDGDEGCIYF